MTETVPVERQQSQQSNFNALNETLGSTLTNFGSNNFTFIDNVEYKRSLPEKRARSEEPSGNRPRDPSDDEHSDSGSDKDGSFKGTKKSERQDDPPQKKVEDFDKLSVHPDPVAKKLSQVNMHSTQYTAIYNNPHSPNFSRT